MNYIKSLDKVTKNDFHLVGGKGANLGEMIAAGFPVPGGFVVVTDAYRKFIQINRIEEKMMLLLKSISPENFTTIEEASDKIKGFFIKGDIPPEVMREIDSLGSFFKESELSVRSSATVEDLPGISFAGQYSSYLNVKGDEVYISIKKCWASLWNARAIS